MNWIKDTIRPLDTVCAASMKGDIIHEAEGIWREIGKAHKQYINRYINSFNVRSSVMSTLAAYEYSHQQQLRLNDFKSYQERMAELFGNFKKLLTVVEEEGNDEKSKIEYHREARQEEGEADMKVVRREDWREKEDEDDWSARRDACLLLDSKKEFLRIENVLSEKQNCLISYMQDILTKCRDVEETNSRLSMELVNDVGFLVLLREIIQRFEFSVQALMRSVRNQEGCTDDVSFVMCLVQGLQEHTDGELENMVEKDRRNVMSQICSEVGNITWHICEVLRSHASDFESIEQKYITDMQENIHHFLNMLRNYRSDRVHQQNQDRQKEGRQSTGRQSKVRGRLANNHHNGKSPASELKTETRKQNERELVPNELTENKEREEARTIEQDCMDLQLAEPANPCEDLQSKITYLQQELERAECEITALRNGMDRSVPKQT